MTSLAIFDLDRTLVRGNISFAFGAYLWRIGQMKFKSALYCTSTYVRHKFIQRSLRALHLKVLRGFLRGRPLRQLRREVERFLDEWFERMKYGPAMQRLEAAKARGAHILLISCSPDFLVGAVAKRLGISDWEATRYGVDNREELSTISSFVEGKEKARVALQRAEALDIERPAVSAFSDSADDLPLLEVAGEAVGVRPGRRLKAICKERGWEII